MTNRMYSDLAAWWPLLSPPDEYMDEVEFFRPLITAELARNGLSDAPTLLELGCGGGNIASFLKSDFAQTTLTDISPDMLAVSKSLNPDCEHIAGDMRTLRLNRTFSVVFVHDAIDYMTDRSDLKRALETAYIHCNPGGFAVFVPDYVAETFEPDTDHGGSDGEERALRYLEWVYDPNETDTTYTADYAYMLREGDQTHVEHDRHICGLFPQVEWLRLLREVGFTSDIRYDQYKRNVFVAQRTA